MMDANLQEQALKPVMQNGTVNSPTPEKVSTEKAISDQTASGKATSDKTESGKATSDKVANHDAAPDQNYGPRRSARNKRAPAKFMYDDDEEYMEKTSPASKATLQELPQRPPRPKRKAAVAAQQAMSPQDYLELVRDVLNPMKPVEINEYAGWVELESEPGFFNAMLWDWGAEDFKIEELVSIGDDDLIKALPKPVYGLVFLFPYTDGNNPPQLARNYPKDLWFSNQTTANACATVAMINVIMNAQDIPLGPELQKFKDDTKDLTPPYRGIKLHKNDFIRAVHNSTARRIDLLAEDLLLENKAKEWEKNTKKKKTQKKRKQVKKQPKKSRSKAKRKTDDDTANHYIAYVPVGGKVWELDGLEKRPVLVGAYNKDTHDDESGAWLAVAQKAIMDRVQNNLPESGLFNLLAICHSPLASIPPKLASCIVKAKAIHALFRGNSEWAFEDPAETYTAEKLTPLGLSPDAISEVVLLEAFTNKLKRVSKDIEEASIMVTELQEEMEKLEVGFVAEKAAHEEAMDMKRGRQRDYTPALLAWIEGLVEAGIYEDVIRQYKGVRD